MMFPDDMETLDGIEDGEFRSSWAPGQPHS